VPVSNANSRRNDFVEVDTTNILFICSGAFVGIEKIVEARIKHQSMGFNSKLKNKDDKEWQEYIDHEDLITYGLIPELVGRLPNLVTLNDLKENHMVQILKDSNASIIPQVQKLLEFDELEVSFEDSYFRDVAKIAKSKKTGARGLKSIVENSLLSIMFRSPELKDLGVVEIKFRQYPTKNIDTYPLFIYNNGNEVVDTEYKIKLRG
jgi:ATP-dependent Clp protease ATP-binding subunit ClpX